MIKLKKIFNFFIILLVICVSTNKLNAQSSCPLFIPKPATFVSASIAATVGNINSVIDGEGKTGLPSSGYAGVCYWLRSQNPVTFNINMNSPSTISRVKFYQPWGVDEGARNVTVRLYNGVTLLSTEAIILPSLYPAGYIAVLGNTYNNVTRIQMVIVDDYNISSATPKRTSLTEVVFGDTAITTAPSVKSLNYSCPATSVNLATAHTGTIPSGSTLVWYPNSTHTGTALTASEIANAVVGTYYAFYYDNTNNCYSPVSSPVVITNLTTLDSDGDGLPDACDLDVDNDGIKDIDENCSGFLAQNTSGVWKGKTSSNLTATLTGATAQANVHTFLDQKIKFYVNQNGGDQRYAKNGNITITYTFSNPVPANEIAFFIDDVDPAQFNTPTVRFDFKVNGGDPNGNFILPNFATPPTAYLNFNNITGRITSSDATLDNQRIIIKGVGDLLVSTITITSANINTGDGVAYALFANSPCDKDNDGIPNIYDLDSDGDGCSDAKEGAGNYNPTNTASGNLATQTPNQNFGVAVDANGIPITVGTAGQDVGQSQDSTKNDCIDTDGDGVPDWQDLDDDNDGILDTNECGSTDRISNGTFPTSGGDTNTLTGWTLGGTYSGVWTSSIGKINLNSNGLEFRRDGSTITTISQNLTGVMSGTRINLNNVYWKKSQTNNVTSRFILDISYGGIVYATIDSTFGDTPTIIAKNGASVNINSLPSITTTSIPITGVLSSKTNIIINLPYNVVNSGTLLFTFNAGTSSNNVRDLGMQSVTLFSCKDTDGDGIPDYLDLDSDNDGCSDAIEGSANFTSSNLVNSSISGGNSSTTSGTYNQPVIQNLGNTVGNTATTIGIPTIANTGQTIGDSQNFAANSQCIASFCYKPAVTAGTVLDTNHGISSLGRAGSNNGNWPMIRKGAWTALEAKTKGFVINRIATTANVENIANPVEGMTVYDEEADCLKINTDGTTSGWKCFNTQACPD